MTPVQIWILATLAGAFLLLVTEVLPAGITGLLTIASLLLANALFDTAVAPNNLAFTGLTNPAVIAVASMFVISAGVSRTGAVGLFVNRFMKDESASRKHYVFILLFVMVASAFMNNTPLVLIFMPVILGLATKMGKAPSKLLIPLSFVSIMGGMCTKIGTSTNIVVAAAIQEHLSLGMFEFSSMGVILAFFGVFIVILFGEKLLPSRASLGLATGAMAAEYMTELEIVSGSRFIGSKINEVFDPQLKKVRVLQHIRNDVIHVAKGDVLLQDGDLLLIKGDPVTIMDFHHGGDTGVMPAVNTDEPFDAPNTRRVAVSLVEVVVKPGSRWVDRRVRNVKFRERYGVSVFAVQRHGSHLREKVEDLVLRPGDILLVQGPMKNLENLKVSDNFLIVEGIEARIPHTLRAPFAVLAVIVFIAMAVAAPAQVHVAALVSALLMVIGRCVTANQAYESLDWDVLFLLGGTLSLGAAFETTGLASLIAENLVSTCEPFGQRAAIAGIFCFTAFITQVLSNNAAAAIMTPLAYSAGVQFAANSGLGSDPQLAMPFVMAVAFGASCCFLTPIGYGTNLLIYGPGGYRFTDFLRLGLPLTLLFAILATIFLPIIYG